MKIQSVLFLLVLSACASNPAVKQEPETVPAWAIHPENSYPATRYLVSVGVGAGRDEGIRDARKQMAEAFMVKVQSATQVRSGSKMTENTSGGVSGDAEQNISKEVNFESNARLRGAEVKEVQKVGKDTYVLLVLDKLSARSGLLLDSSRIKSKLDAELDALEAGFSAARLKEAKADLDAIRDLSSEASVLGMGAVVDASPYESRLAKLDGSIRAKNEKKIFALKTLKGDDAFARAIEVCLQDQGASVYTGEVLPEGSNQVQVSVIEHAQHMNIEGWVKTRFEVTANIVASNGKSYRVIENQTETARTREAGLESASEEISKKLCDQIWNRVGEMK